MKIQLRRFAVLALLGSMLASALVAGCGGGEDTSGGDAGGAGGTGNAAGNAGGAGNAAGGAGNGATK